MKSRGDIYREIDRLKKAKEDQKNNDRLVSIYSNCIATLEWVLK